MVLASGVFDGLHAGHVAYLEAAKALCLQDELLVCAVAPDAYGLTAKGRALGWPQAERVHAVRGLQAVDAAIAQGDLSVASVIREYRPRLFVKGPEWKGRLPEEVWLACTQTGTVMAFVETPGTHTSVIAQRRRDAADDEALATLETLVQTQRPATAPWAPITDYSVEARTVAEGPHAALIVDVLKSAWPGRSWDAEDVTALRVVDVGCGPGHLVRMLRERGVPAYGQDRVACPTWCDRPLPDDPSRRVLDWRPVFSIMDITDDPQPGIEIWAEETKALTGDLVICREVLEHLTVRQIVVAVRNLCRMSDGLVYVTTRFAQAPRHVFDVDRADDLDPTHITMLTQPFLRALFVLQGFTRRMDLEETLDWKHLGRVLVYARAAS